LQSTDLLENARHRREAPLQSRLQHSQQGDPEPVLPLQRPPQLPSFLPLRRAGLQVGWDQRRRQPDDQRRAGKQPQRTRQVPHSGCFKLFLWPVTLLSCFEDEQLEEEEVQLERKEGQQHQRKKTKKEEKKEEEQEDENEEQHRRPQQEQQQAEEPYGPQTDAEDEGKDGEKEQEKNGDEEGRHQQQQPQQQQSSQKAPRSRQRRAPRRDDGTLADHPTFDPEDEHPYIFVEPERVREAAANKAILRDLDVDFFRLPMKPAALKELSKVFHLSGTHSYLTRQSDLLKAAVQVKSVGLFLIRFPTRVGEAGEVRLGGVENKTTRETVSHRCCPLDCSFAFRRLLFSTSLGLRGQWRFSARIQAGNGNTSSLGCNARWN
jgi:hypothetical protein